LRISKASLVNELSAEVRWVFMIGDFQARDGL
jgi:hypothetical protein